MTSGVVFVGAATPFGIVIVGSPSAASFTVGSSGSCVFAVPVAFVGVCATTSATTTISPPVLKPSADDCPTTATRSPTFVHARSAPKPDPPTDRTCGLPWSKPTVPSFLASDAW
jgi:hypothetical protein